MKYNHKAVEEKWQKIWEDKGVFHASDDTEKEKFYALIEFPYPSGQGLHVGHPRPYTALDTVARKRRLEVTMFFILSVGTLSVFLPRTMRSRITFTLKL